MAGRFHEEKTAGGPRDFDAFARVLTIAKWDAKFMKKHEKLTPKKVDADASAKALEDQPLEGPTRIESGAGAAEPANCSDSAPRRAGNAVRVPFT